MVQQSLFSIAPSPSFYEPYFQESFEERYEQEIRERALQLIDDEALNAMEEELYKQGEISFDVLYKIAEEKAKKDISDKIEGLYDCCDY